MEFIYINVHLIFAFTNVANMLHTMTMYFKQHLDIHCILDGSDLIKEASGDF